MEFARLYDAFNPWGPGDDFYLALARKLGGPVLDLGCGTGMLACRIAEEITPVTGVDPAEGMLHIARSRPGAERVEWIKGDARTLDLKRHFSLIYLTGHAFQVFLTDADSAGDAEDRRPPSGATGMSCLRYPQPGGQGLARLDAAGKPRESPRLPGLGASRNPSIRHSMRRRGIASIAHRYRFLDKGTETDRP